MVLDDDAIPDIASNLMAHLPDADNIAAVLDVGIEFSYTHRYVFRLNNQTMSHRVS